MKKNRDVIIFYTSIYSQIVYIGLEDFKNKFHMDRHDVTFVSSKENY